MGIETDTDIDYGRIFGPFPDVGQISKSLFIGLLTTDEHEENCNIKVNINTAGLSVTWLPYIRAARTEDEQNIEAYTKNGQIYYRALRIIKCGEELLVWYSKDFCQILGIPTVKPQRNAESHVCEFCGSKFRYPYPLMAHIKFRCTSACYGSTSSLFDNNKINTVNNVEGEKRDESVPHSTKRPADTDYSIPVKRLFEDKVIEINNNNNGTSTGNSSEKAQISSGETDLNESWSAFKKVEKSKLGDLGRKTDSKQFSQEFSHHNKLTDTVRAKYEHELSAFLCNKSTASAVNIKETPRSLGMLMSNSWMLSNSYTAQQYAEHQAVHNTLMQLSVDKRPVNRGRDVTNSVLESSALQLQTNDVLNKQMIIDELQSFQLSHYKPTNPMVDKLMHTATQPTLLQRPMRTLGVAQNWCAKCNASFRMTSDLVYHMRSHHKREFDPMKRKREEKLQCNVCQETFKERHHLTRHMTSHT